MLGLGLAEIGLESEGVGGGDALPGSQAGSHFGQAPLLSADGYLARFKALGGADERRWYRP